jgi:hypothetical protein
METGNANQQNHRVCDLIDDKRRITMSLVKLYLARHGLKGISIY